MMGNGTPTTPDTNPAALALSDLAARADAMTPGDFLRAAASAADNGFHNLAALTARIGVDMLTDAAGVARW